MPFLFRSTIASLTLSVNFYIWLLAGGGISRAVNHSLDLAMPIDVSIRTTARLALMAADLLEF